MAPIVPPLPAAVATFENDHQAFSGRADIGLQLDQFDLQQVHMGLVILALHFLTIGVILGQNVILVGGTRSDGEHLRVRDP